MGYHRDIGATGARSRAPRSPGGWRSRCVRTERGSRRQRRSGQARDRRRGRWPGDQPVPEELTDCLVPQPERPNPGSHPYRYRSAPDSRPTTSNGGAVVGGVRVVLQPGRSAEHPRRGEVVTELRAGGLQVSCRLGVGLEVVEAEVLGAFTATPACAATGTVTARNLSTRAPITPRLNAAHGLHPRRCDSSALDRPRGRVAIAQLILSSVKVP